MSATRVAPPDAAPASDGPLLADRIYLIQVRRQDVTSDPEAALAECGVPAGHVQAWAAGWSDPAIDTSAVLLVRLEQFWVTMTRPGASKATVAAMQRLTVADAVAWLCTYRAIQRLPFPATNADPAAYAAVPPGWVYLAAGLTPQEAAEVPVEHALAMVALRGITLPRPKAP